MNPVHLVILFLVFIFTLKICLLWYNSPKQKGSRGERRVAARLRRGLSQEYLIYNDIYLPLDDGTTTQLDHVIVSRYGVFVIETKNYEGWIFANEKSAKWTQIIYRKKSQFQNPLRQNYHHRCAIANVLGISVDYIIGVVVFTEGCEFKTEMPDGVVYSGELAKHIKAYNVPIFKPREVDMIGIALNEWANTVDEERKASHVDNLMRKHGSSK